MKTAMATLAIEVYVTCPHCDKLLDLMDRRDTNGRDHDEDHQILEQACPDGHWIDAHKEFNIEDVTCSHCKKTFNVGGLEW